MNKIERIPSGIEGLDNLIQGGFEKNSVILVCGDAGSGKTTFCLQFLYYGAIKYNEPGVFISFEESKESLCRHTYQYGWDIPMLEKKGMMRIIEYKPHQVVELIKEGGGPIRDCVEAIGAKRLGIDSLTSYSMLFETPYKARQSILSLFDLLRSWKCTSMVISEVAVSLTKRESAGMEFLADAVIMLYSIREETVKIRGLEVMKMRATGHADKVCPIQFGKNGIVVYPDESMFGKI